MKYALRLIFACSLVFLALAGAAASAQDDFALKDGDRVVFMGDSITAERTYGKVVEQYTLLRYPDRKVTFTNVGWGGDTAKGGLARLERDVFANNATVLTVAFGVNDIGWGMRADDEHKQEYLDSIREIVRRCKEKGVRVYICSAAVTGADPNKSENEFLQKMCDEGMEIARNEGGNSIDLQRGMREIQKKVFAFRKAVPDKKNPPTLHAPDGIHLSPMGALAMGVVMLKGLGAPMDVSSATVDAGAGGVTEAKGCKISDIQKSGERIEFTRLDEGLPFNTEPFLALNFAFIQIPEMLNRYMLTVTNLPEGRFTLTVDGREVATHSAQEWASGKNISTATTSGFTPGGPWAAQAKLVDNLTQARDELDQARFVGRILISPEHLTQFREDSKTANAEIEKLQREMAKPRPYHFVLDRAVEKPKKE